MDLLVWYILSLICATIPMWFVEQYIKTKNIIYYVYFLIFSFLLMLSYVNIFEYEPISSTYVLLQVLVMIIIVSYGIYLGEHLNICKITGIILALGSVYLLSE